MNTKTAVLLVCGALAVGVAVHCGGGTPTQPPVTVPTQPATTTTTVPVGIVLPTGMVCDPTPPPLRYVAVKVWDTSNPNRVILDSKPVVQNVDSYCERILGVSGKFCDTRLEGDPQRVACDWLAIGKATDTGVWGPTWNFNGSKCVPYGGSGDCVHDRDNGFRVYAKASGTYEGCASPLAQVYPDEGDRCGQVTITIPCTTSHCQ